MSATTVSAPLRSKAALRASFEWTRALRGTPFARSSSTTARPVLPVAPVTRIFGYFIGNLLTEYEFQLLLRRPTANQASEREQGTNGNVLVVHQVLFRQRQRVHHRVGLLNGL